jgi:16S rRNA (cytosine967-C5)-methyltransferase
MTPAARLAATIELLGLVEATPRPADATVSTYFRARRYIGSKDRAAIAGASYRIMRRHARLSWWLERSGAEPSPRGLALADLLVGERIDAAVVENLFSGGAYAPDSLSRDERALVRQLSGHTLAHPEMPESAAAECPPWAEPELRRALGAQFSAEMAALEGPAPLDLRVNPLKADRATVLAGLRAQGIQAEPTRLSPFGIRVEGRPAIAALALYKEGAIEIQDEGSQLVALMVDARPGQQVVDFCAGAGGKTLAVAAAMANKGRVIATDVLAGRLMRARERFRRAGIHNIQARPLVGETDPWIKRHKGSFDRVLVDAPCSGTGTWRRNPDMRWRPLGPGLGELVPLQARLLQSAARLVRPGGRLIYATCSLLPTENQDQAEGFLASHPDFVAKDAGLIWRDTVAASGCNPEPPPGPYLSLSPARDGTDGFFAAIFERKAAPGDDEKR